MYGCQSCTWSAAEKMNISMPPFAPENLVSRDEFDSLVPHQPAHLHTQASSGAYLRDSSRFPRRRPFIYLNRHTPSGHSRVYRVTQLRTDGIHCRQSADTRPVVLKVVRVTGAAFSDVTHGPVTVRLSFHHSPTKGYGLKVGRLRTFFSMPTVGMKWAC